MKLLKKCPFCGSEAELKIEPMWCDAISSDGYHGNYEYYVKCKNDKCKLERKRFDDIYCKPDEAMSKAIDSWENRVE